MLALLAGAAAWDDMRKDIIPNQLMIFGAGLGVVLRIAVSISERAPLHILMMVPEVILLFICLCPFYRMGGLGAGDCKLLLMAGVFLPAKQALFVVVGTFFAAAAEILVLELVRGIMRKKKRIKTIHFAPAFLMAVFICLIETLIK